MKNIISTILIIFALISCSKDIEDIPDYLPGRLTEVSHEAYSLGIVFHKYEYSGEDITDSYYYSSPKIFISKYNFENKQLKEIHFSFQNTDPEYDLTDSIKYIYSDSSVIEKYFDYSDGHSEVYGLKNGKIISSTWDYPNKIIEFYYEWKGDNLVRIVNEFWYGFPLTANITEYVFEYSDIENPFYLSNIPQIMKEFTNPNNHVAELTEFIPKCSKNFPLKLTIIKDGPLWDGPTVFQKYTFECKTFLNANKPYEVKLKVNDNILMEYFLTYEER